MRHIKLTPVGCLALPHIPHYPHYLINGMIFKKKVTKHKVFIFLLYDFCLKYFSF